MSDIVPGQKTGGGNGGGLSISLSLPADPTAGNFIAVSVSAHPSSLPTYTVTDNAGNTYASAASVTHDGTAKTQIFRAFNVATVASHSITITSSVNPSGNGSSLKATIEEYSGVITASDPTDKNGTATASASGPVSTSSTGTLAQADELVISAIGDGAGLLNYTQGGTYTKNTEVDDIETLASEYKVVAATTAVTGDWSISAANASGLVVATFKALPPAPLEQEGHRWRDDDGSETTASWLAAQDAALTRTRSVNTRLRVLVNATGDPPTTTMQLEVKEAADASYSKVEPIGGGALATGTGGTVTTTGTTAPTVAYPSGITIGDKLLMFVANRPATSTPATPSGWTQLATQTGGDGAGAGAADTGDVRMTVFERQADGTESGSVTLSITSGTSCGARIIRYPKTTGKVWQVAVTSGATPTTGSTSWSITGGSNPGMSAGDFVVVGSVANSDAATYSAEALTQTGATFGTMTEISDTAITTGNDMRLVIADFPVSTGPSSAAPVYSMTASTGTPEGASIIVRLRQVTAPITLSPSSNITASGEATTAQLAAPSGKTTSDFVAGRMQDDENPSDTIDITTDDYTEVEWSLVANSLATDGLVYSFRVTAGGTPLTTYSVTPQWTIGTVSPAALIPRRGSFGQDARLRR